jgi:GxxExxY protein
VTEPGRIDRINAISHAVIGSSIEVHRALGLGLLESAYEVCLAHEMSSRGLEFQKQVDLPVVYKKVRLDCGYRMDFVVEDLVIVEIKAIETVLPIHRQQVLSYLRLNKKPLGLLINFHTPVLKDGIDRIINTLI